jgi:uncharacterized protein (DUF924 family)
MSIARPVAAAEKVLQFWFGPSHPHVGSKPMWFKKDLVLDETIRTEFLEIHASVAANPSIWSSTDLGTLAAIICLDQFSRNMFRGDKGSFAYDAAALELSKTLLAKGPDPAVFGEW